MNLHKKRVLFYGFSTLNHFFREVTREMIAGGHDKNDIGVIYPNGQYRRFYKNILPEENSFYLYSNYNAVFKAVRSDRNYTVINQALPDNAFTILSADKDGFRSLSSDKQIDHIETIYRIYSAYLDLFRPDYIVFPDIEVVDGYMLYALARARNIPIAYAFHLRNLGRSILGESITEAFPTYFGTVNDDGRAEAARYMSALAETLPKPGFFNPVWSDGKRLPLPPRQPAIRRLLRSLILKAGKERHYQGEDSYILKIKIALLPGLQKFRSFMYRNLALPRMQIRKIEDLPQRFHLFALQVTPESSINYLAPLYIDQIRAIDEIRMALPPGVWLVVKEHPGMIGVRTMDFYNKLLKMPGVLLADANISMEKFRPRVEVMHTITGTVGLECLFSGRPCYMFGNNFFSRYAPNKTTDPDLKVLLAKDMDEIINARRNVFINDLPKIFSIAHSFVVAEPFSNPHVMIDRNIQSYIAALADHYQRIGKSP